MIWCIGISPEFSRLWVLVTHVFFFEQTIHSFLLKTSLKMQSGANTFLKTHFKFLHPKDSTIYFSKYFCKWMKILKIILKLNYNFKLGWAQLWYVMQGAYPQLFPDNLFSNWKIPRNRSMYCRECKQELTCVLKSGF